MIQTFVHPVHGPIKLGRIKSDRVFLAKAPKLRNYLSSSIPAPPSSMGYITAVPSWPMLGNDKLGDCVEADQLHEIQQKTQYLGSPVTPTTQDAINLYTAEGGYVPGNPSTDNGTDMGTAVQYQKNTGISVGGKNHKTIAYATVDLTNLTEVMQAVWLCGSVMLGVDLPISAQRPKLGGNGHLVWEVPATGVGGNGAPGSWGGHCIPIMGYKAGSGFEVISWGAVYDVTPNFLAAYGDEAFVVLSQDWLEKSGNAVSHVNVKQLLADLASL